MPGDRGGEWERAEVLARFDKGRIIPLRFRAAGAPFVVERVNYAWTERHGKSLVYFFSVSDKRDSYRLCLDSETMSWRAAPLQ